MRSMDAQSALEGGYFVEYVKSRGRFKESARHKNTLTATGAGWLLRSFFRGEALAPATYYMGLTNATYTFDSNTLASMAAGEPVGNGYARMALVKNTTDWTVQELGTNIMQALSKLVTFTCTTAPWTINWVRGFICDAAAGTAGNVIAVSGPAPAPRVVLVGAGPTLNYQYYLRA